jgi:hypothetical protein
VSFCGVRIHSWEAFAQSRRESMSPFPAIFPAAYSQMIIFRKLAIYRMAELGH